MQVNHGGFVNEDGPVFKATIGEGHSLGGHPQRGKAMRSVPNVSVFCWVQCHPRHTHLSFVSWKHLTARVVRAWDQWEVHIERDDLQHTQKYPHNCRLVAFFVVWRIPLTKASYEELWCFLWSAPGSCRPQMGPMLAPWTLLSGVIHVMKHFNWCPKNGITICRSMRLRFKIANYLNSNTYHFCEKISQEYIIGYFVF